MKMTNRERTLLYILIYVIIFVLGLNFIISPMWGIYQENVLKYEEYRSLNLLLKREKENTPMQEKYFEEIQDKNKILNENFMDYKSNEDIEELISSYSTNLKIIEFASKENEEVKLMQDLLSETTQKIIVKNVEFTLSGDKSNLPQLITSLNNLNGCEIERIEAQGEDIEIELTFLQI